MNSFGNFNLKFLVLLTVFSSFSVESFARSYVRGDGLDFVEEQESETNTEDGLIFLRDETVLSVTEKNFTLQSLNLTTELPSVGKMETYPEAENATALAQMWFEKYTQLLKSYHDCQKLENNFWYEKYVIMRSASGCMAVLLLLMILAFILCNLSCKDKKKKMQRYNRSDAVYAETTATPLRVL